MDAGTLSIGKIFGQDRRYLVPLFQRPYVWNEDDQWEPLWDDVPSVGERLVAGPETRPHFLAAIVLDQMRKPTGQVDDPAFARRFFGIWLDPRTRDPELRTRLLTGPDRPPPG